MRSISIEVFQKNIQKKGHKYANDTMSWRYLVQCPNAQSTQILLSMYYFTKQLSLEIENLENCITAFNTTIHII